MSVALAVREAFAGRTWFGCTLAVLLIVGSAVAGAGPGAAPIAERPGEGAAGPGRPGVQEHDSGSPLPIYRHVTNASGLGGFLHAGFAGPGNLEDPRAVFTEFTGPGACWLDYDADGWLDLYLVNTRYQSEPEKNDALDPHSMLYRNNGDGTFADATAAANARTQGILQGCAAADYTNNGYPDLYVTGWNGSYLLRNDGGVFTDVTLAAGVEDVDCGDFACWASSAVWFDPNRDGCLDLFILHFTEFDPENPPPGSGPGPGQYNRFFQNACDGTFTDRTAAVGLRDVKSDSWSAVASDLGFDGWPDLYVSNDGDPNDVYRNNRDGTFTRVSDSAASDPFAGMGTAVADFDRDGRHDLVTTNFMQQTNGIYQSFGFDYLNIGENPPFDDADPYSGWGVNWFDMDNDGRLDLMVFNGITEDLGLVEPRQPVLSYRNLGAAEFESVRGSLGPDLDGRWIARGGAWGDYDNDGDVDFVLAEAGEAPTHLFNAYGVGNRFLSVDVRSESAGVARDAIGTRVRVTADGAGSQMQEKVAGSSYMSSGDPRLHFGLANATTADVTVRWPGGGSETFDDVPANAFVRIVQGVGLEIVRTLPLVTLTGPEEPVRRLDEARFHVDAVPADGRTIASYAWDFGDGTTRSGGTTESHRFLDVGNVTVRVTVTDSAGDRRSQWAQATIWDDLSAEVAMAREVFGPDEVPHGEVRVAFSDGAPVARAAVELEIRRTSGDPAVDELIGELPFFVHELIGWVPMQVSGETDVNGTFAFTVPENVVEPTPLVPLPLDYHPGVYVATARGGARGSVFEPAQASYHVIVPAT